MLRSRASGCFLALGGCVGVKVLYDCVFQALGHFFSVIILYSLSLIHISEPTRLGMISYAVFCLKKKTVTLSHFFIRIEVCIITSI